MSKEEISTKTDHVAWELQAFTIFVKDEKTTEESHSCEIGNTVGNSIECSCYNPMHPTFNNYLVSAVKYLHREQSFYWMHLI